MTYRWRPIQTDRGAVSQQTGGCHSCQGECTNGPNSLENVCSAQTDLASVVVDDEALVPAVEVLMGIDQDSELLQHGLVGSLAHCVHGGTYIIQHAHDARGILGSRGKHFTLISSQKSLLLHQFHIFWSLNCRYNLKFNTPH